MKKVVCLLLLLFNVGVVNAQEEGEDVEFIDISDVYFEDGVEYAPVDDVQVVPVEEVSEVTQEGVTEEIEEPSVTEKQTEPITTVQDPQQGIPPRNEEVPVQEDVKREEPPKEELNKEEKDKDDTKKEENKKKKYIKAYRRWSNTVNEYQWIGSTNKIIKKVPFETVYEDDPNYKEGYLKELTQGQEGEMLIELQQRVNDKGEGINVVMTEYLRKPPMSRIIRRGTGKETTFKAKVQDWISDLSSWVNQNNDTIFVSITLLMVGWIVVMVVMNLVKTLR